MNKRIGTYLTKTVAGEAFKAYLPHPLPPDPALDLGKLYTRLEKATLALAELNSMANAIPNPSLFLYMYVRKEALLSSQIEGTQSSLSDLLLFEHHQKQTVSLEDVEEVSHYVQAINHGRKRLKDGFPLSLRLLKEMHGILLSGGRGAEKLPGELRRSQNWIGGTRPGNALFVPPPVENMMDCLSNLEKFLHDPTLPALIRAGVAHVQFETIHPFLDGNGRLGRALIALVLCESGLLDEPILYISLYLKQNRTTYYELLQETRTRGTWETWLEFFLDGIVVSCKQAIHTAQAITTLFEHDRGKIATLGRARFSCEKTLAYLQRLPQVSVALVTQTLGVTAPTARSTLNHMVKLGILEETSGNKRSKVYVYQRYLTLLAAGTEPLT